MPLKLKNDIKDVVISGNFIKIETFCDNLERDMDTINDNLDINQKKLEVNSSALVRIEKKIDEANDEKKPGSITVSAVEYRVFTFLLFFGLFGWETISKSKFLQTILGKLF